MVKENKRICVNDTIQISYSKEARRINRLTQNTETRRQVLNYWLVKMAEFSIQPSFQDRLVFLFLL